MAKISIIIPAYNVEDYIESCLLSVINQTLKDIEIIVINDGSRDNTASIIKKYAQQDTRIKFIDKENSGVVMARKTGLDIATGDYIHYLDGDDCMEPNSYELLYNRALESDADMIMMEFYVYENKRYEFTPILKDYNNFEFIDHCLTNFRNFGLSLHIHKRELYKNDIIYCENLTYCEDFVINVQLAYYSKKITFTNLSLYHYIFRENSTMNCKISDNKALNMKRYPHELQRVLIDKPIYSQLAYKIERLKVIAIVNIFRARYLKNGHANAKEAMAIVDIYPEFKRYLHIKPMYKVIKLYSISSILGRIFAQYYISKGKIRY